MPRYYFHIHRKDRCVRDPQGVLFADPTEAKQFAEQTALALLCALPSNYASRDQIEVVEENETTGFSLPFRFALGGRLSQLVRRLSHR